LVFVFFGFLVFHDFSPSEAVCNPLKLHGLTSMESREGD